LIGKGNSAQWLTPGFRRGEHYDRHELE